jgi:hypothetical protein
MDYGDMISESFDYAKEAVWGKWSRWVLLVISTIIFPLILGYIIRIYSGAKPAPELENWGKLFIDGLKLFIIGIIYAIPVWVIAAIFFVPAIGLLIHGGNANNPAAIAAGIGTLGIGLLLVIIIGIIISLIATIGIIRFARTDSMGQAFAFHAVLEHIGNIGWVDYIVALIVLWIVGIVFGIIISIIDVIPFIGWLIALFLYPAYIIFQARYMVRIYDSAPAPA